MPDDTYIAHGRVEWFVKDAWRLLLRYSFDMNDITTNVRRAGDVAGQDTAAAAGRTMPGVAIAAEAEQSVKGTNEYHVRCRIICETDARTDTTGEKLDALVGIVRDEIHKEGTGGRTIVDRLNDQRRGFVIHEDGVLEGNRDDEQEGDIRRAVLNVDIWGYVGRSS